jgi:dTDP-L-rhamnose 4-epimerase
MLVLVTGAAGFIGSQVVDALSAAGHDVRGVDALLPTAHGSPSELPGGTVHGDLRDPDVARAAAHGVDAVVHHAAMVGLGTNVGDIDAYVSHNALGTAVLLRALAERSFAGRIVLASSMVVYGEGGYVCARHGTVRPGPRRIEDLAARRFEPSCPQCARPLDPVPVTEDAPLDPRSIYAATKVHQEHLVACYARESDGVGATALRYHNVYGPRMPRDTPYAGVAAVFRSALEHGRDPRVFEDGAQLRDFVAVEDVARATVLALDGRPGAYNVGTGRPRPLLDMARALAAAHSSPAAPRVTGEFRRGDVRHVFAATDRAASALGYRGRTTVEEGMRHSAVRAAASTLRSA